MTDELVLIAGAGFSKWAADLPLVAQLFDFCFAPFGVREERRLARVRILKHEWDHAHPTGHPEQFISEILATGKAVAADLVWYIARRLADPYIWTEHHAWRTRRHVLSIDESRKNDRPGVARVRSFLGHLARAGLSGVVTTNYDMLIEYALGTRAFNYGAQEETLSGRGPYPVSTWLHPVVVSGDLPLAKLHGSLSWTPDGRFSDGRGALTGKALIVPPVHEKKMPQYLRNVWSTARLTLGKASRLVIFGFAFNPYDEAVLALLRESGTSIRRVLLIDPRPNIPAATATWPGARVDTCEPASVERAFREWLEADTT